MTEKNVEHEQHVHGARWAAVDDGYFVSPEVARPLVDATLDAVAQSRPAAVVDLGGGTGFILERLIDSGIDANIKLVDLDDSAAQLEEIHDGRITRLKASIPAFHREHLGIGDGGLVFITRSTLHYANVMGQRPWLHHIRGEMRPGEFFIHQTLDAPDADQALVANLFLEHGRQGKWVCARAVMRRILDEANLPVESESQARTLTFPERDLVDRYKLSAAEIQDLKSDLAQYTDKYPELVELTANGLNMHFPYRIYTCRAR